MNKNFNGILELNDDNQYIVNGLNLSEVLENNWLKEIPAIYSLFVNGKEKFNEEGIFYKKKNVGLLYDLTILGNNLEEKLFKYCGKNVEFDITYGKVS